MNTLSSIRLCLLVGLPPILAAVPNIVLLAAAADRLPDPLATHFAADGADGFTGRIATMFVSAGIGAGLAIVFAAILLAGVRRNLPLRRADSAVDPIRLLVGTAWGVGGFLGVIMLAGTIANLDMPDPAQVTLSGWAFATAAIAGLLLAAAGWIAAPESPVEATAPAPAEPLAIGRTEKVSWSRRAASPWMLMAGVVAVLMGVVLGFVAQPLIGVLLALTGVLLAHLALLRVVVDQRGLTVGIGPLGWPRWRLRPEDIAEVSAEDISPLQYGGYGIRLIPGATAVVLRGGPGLVVTRRSGRRFVVSVDDADTGAGVLAGVVTRAG
ncbi:hypothetical protein [Nocardia sp. NBC_01329]|uniref:hypothetical protein n=1 Tax=Nocardia sp. NBC_01329 TaxID=2903594 RepID=UPI002E124220|nr:hypothetical protein OG405_02230 [Nocardia sp. NBC_01329]